MQTLLKIISFLLHHPTHIPAEDKMHKPKEFQEKFSESLQVDQFLMLLLFHLCTLLHFV